MSPLARLSHILRRRLAARISVQLALLAVIVVGALTWRVYVDSMARARTVTLAQLQDSAANRAREASTLFALAQDHTALLRDEYLRRLNALGGHDPQAEFGRWFARWPDGLTRVRRELDNPARLPTVYLRPTVRIDADVRRRTLVAFELLREWGPVLAARFFSAYIDLPGEGLVMYSPTVNWGQAANSDTTNFDYPPVQLSTPAANPARRNRWTPMYYDDKAAAYMVSTATPVDRAGRWIAVAAQDVVLDALLQGLGTGTPEGSYSVIVSREGDLIAHPQFGEKIHEGGGSVRIDSLADPLLNEIFAAVHAFADATGVRQTGNGEAQLGVARIDGPNWLLVSVYPSALLRSEALAAATPVLALGLLSMAVVVLCSLWIINRGVGRPLQQLEKITHGIAAGQRGLRVDQGRADEIGALGRAFAAMMKKLEEREDLLIEARETLETRVRERTESLDYYNGELARTVERLKHTQDNLLHAEKLAALGALVAGISHELNTPIGNGVLITSTLRDNLGDLAQRVRNGEVKPAVLERFVDENVLASELLLRCLESAADLVSSFKQVAVDRSAAKRRQFDANTVCRDVLATLAPLIAAAGHRLDLSVSGEILMDSYPGSLGQVVSNLVNNALAHAFGARRGGHMQLLLRTMRDDQIELRFRDNGDGIAAENLHRIFEPYFTTRLGQGGSGLGLHVVHTIVSDLLGGRISVRSAPGEGAEFTVVLPRRAPDHAAVQDAGSVIR